MIAYGRNKLGMRHRDGHILGVAKHISLIGMMGVGKSTVAPLVASRLQRSVIEVDQLIEKQEGMAISEIFIGKGEAYFRRLESAMIRLILMQPPAVISLGGGAFQWEPTRELLLESTVVFYLSATLEVLCGRLQSASAARPLLNTPGISLKDTLGTLLEKRRDYYGQAHYVVETDHYEAADVAKAIYLMREAYE